MPVQDFHIAPGELPRIKQHLYSYSEGFDTALCLDNNTGTNAFNYHQYEMVAGFGAKDVLRIDNAGTAFEQLKQFHARHKSWLLGYLTYDLKNEVEKLTSQNADGLDFPALYFFVPEVLASIKGDTLTITAEDPAGVYTAIVSSPPKKENTTGTMAFVQRIPQEEYISKVEKVRQHIEEGDVYEMNLCMEFFAENTPIDPLGTYLELQKISPMPFSAYGKFDRNLYALCASPERFLMKQGDKLVSQPIKGTVRRGATDEEDEGLKKSLYESEKERAENVMIVDLVRNDLGRSAIAGSIKVEELFGIYTFAQVHQMISTISAQLKPGIHWTEAISNAFPMGSMTGAPKVKAMELIELYEESRRGLFSGAIGYVTPDADFDFNVVIRSLLYNAQKSYLSFQVGGAITYDSVPVAEYDECLLKASAIRRLSNKEN